MMEAIVNIVAVSTTAAFCGVMICIGVTLGGYWQSLPPEDFLTWFQANNGFVARSVPLTVAPALVGLIASVSMAWGNSESWLWLGSTLCLTAVLILTVTYFVPSNTAFASGDIHAREVPYRLRQWLLVHGVRILVAAASAILGCMALRG